MNRYIIQYIKRYLPVKVGLRKGIMVRGNTIISTEIVHNAIAVTVHNLMIELIVTLPLESKL